MTTFAEWQHIQNGGTPATGDVFDPVRRYMRMVRDMGQWYTLTFSFRVTSRRFLCWQA
jgi:hypothetical protein